MGLVAGLIALGALVACPTEDDNESSDASLQSLTLNAGSNAISLTPGFASDTLEYDASVVSTVATVTVAALETDGAATVSITPPDADAATDGHQVNLEVGDTDITIVVTAEDDSTTRTYTITVNRAAVGASSDASLNALTLSAGTISPTFASNTTDYTATVSNSVESVTVTATPTDTGARTAIMPADADTDTDGHQVSLRVGDTDITITVTAADNSTMEEYTITVTRSPSTAMVTVTAPSVMEGNTGMTNLVLMVSADRTVTGGIMVTLTPGTATGNATARESADFSVSEQTITLTDTTEQGVTIGTVTGDTDEEGDATIPISVTISTTPAGQAVAAQGSVELLIIDDDYSGILTVGTVATATIAEGEETTFTIALNNLPIADLTIPFTVTGGAEAEDYGLTSGDTTMLTVGDGILTILIAGYNAGTEVSLTFAASEDEIVEGAETATIDFPDTFGGNAVVGSDPAITISASDGTATVTVTAPASLMEGDSGDTNIELGVSSDKVVEGGIMVTLTPGTATGNAGAIESADFSVSVQTITLTDRAGQTVVVGTVAGDSLLEGDATIPVEVTLATDLATVATTPVDVVITDDDQPTAASLSISDGVAREAETPNPGVFTLTLTNADQALGDATVGYELAGSATLGAGNDYGVAAGGDATAKSLTVASGAGADFVIPASALSDGTASATITITPTDDGDNDNTETVELTITSIAFANTANAITTVDGSPQTIYINDNDGPAMTLSVTDADAREVTSGINDGIFSLNTGPSRDGDGQPLTLAYELGGTATPGVDYVGDLISGGGSLTFMSSFQSQTFPLPVGIISDFEVEGDETIILTFTSATRGGHVFDVNGSPATMVITDNDVPNQPQAILDSTTESNTFISEASVGIPHRATLSVGVAPASDATVAYTIATDDTHIDGLPDATLGMDYTIGLSGDVTAPLTETMSSFVIPAAALSDGAADVTITVTAIDDTEMEGTEVIRLTIDSVSFADGSTPAIIDQNTSDTDRLGILDND